MTLREAVYYTAVCDLCSKAHDDGDYSAWADADQADAYADDSDWHVEGGNHLCYDCKPAYDFEDAEADGELDPGHGAEGHHCYADTATAISRVLK